MNLDTVFDNDTAISIPTQSFKYPAVHPHQYVFVVSLIQHYDWSMMESLRSSDLHSLVAKNVQCYIENCSVHLPTDLLDCSEM